MEKEQQNKMKTKLTALLLTILGFAATNTIKAQDNLNAYFEKKITNKNMFFGMNFVNEETGKDKIMMQPYLEINHGPITYANWTNYALKEGRTDEIDHIIKLTQNIKPSKTDNILVSPVIAIYTFPDSQLKDEKAIALESSYEGTTIPINIDLRVEKILNEITNEGLMSSLSISKPIQINENIKATPKGSVVFNDKYFSNNSGITHFDVGANISYDLGKGFAASAQGTYQQKIDNEFQGLVKSEPYFSFTISKFIE